MPSAEATPTLDRRQRKSRAALHAGLVSLIARKPYADITVDDVVNAADLARATFYAHYRDKDALLLAATQELLEELADEVTAISWAAPPGYDGSGLVAILRHAEEHREFYRLLISGQGGPASRQTLITTLTVAATTVFSSGASQGRSPRIPMNLTANAYVGAVLATIESWLGEDIRIDAPILAANFMQLQVSGLEWALGFQPGEMSYTSAD